MSPRGSDVPPWLPPIAARLRERIALFEANGCVEAAATCRRDLEVVEAEARAWWLEELGREEAALERGVSAATIDRRLRAGTLPNAGKRRAPRVARRDLWSASPIASASVVDRRTREDPA
jgi:hypothetical protein